MAGLLAFAMLLTLGPTLTRAKADGATGGTLTDPVSYTLDALFSGTGLLVAKTSETAGYAIGSLLSGGGHNAAAAAVTIDNEIATATGATDWTVTKNDNAVTIKNGNNYLTNTTSGGKFVISTTSGNWSYESGKLKGNL